MAIYPQEINEWLKSQFPDDAVADAQQVDFEGLQENVGGEKINIPVVYGYRRITGPRVLTSVRTTNSQMLYTAIAVCEGPITKYHKLFINDEQIPLIDIADGSRADVTQGTYGGILSYEMFFGNRTQNFVTGTNSGPLSTLLTEITGNAQDIRAFSESMAGVAYVVLRMFYRDQNSPYKSFPKITVEISGRKLRNASTAGFGTEQNVFQDANPADVLLDYLTNVNYGRGMADSKIDATSISNLRSSLATTITPFVNATPVNRARCNYILDTGLSVLSNVKEICRQFGIIMTLANGVYRFIPEYKSSTVSMVVNKSHLIGGYSQIRPDLSVKFNRVSVNYSNALDSFTDSQETIQNSAAITADGKILDLSVDYSATTDPYQARNQAQTLLLKSRAQNTYRFTMVKEALKLTVGDLITWDPNSTGTSTTYLRIIEMTMNPDFTFDITAVTHDDNFYPQFTPGNAAPKRVEIIPGPAGGQTQITPVVPPSINISPAPVPIVGPPPPTPTTATKRKVTVSGTNLTALSDTLPGGDNFYPAIIEKFNNKFTSVDDANYRDSRFAYGYSINSANPGNWVTVSRDGSNPNYNYYYDYRPALFYRERDLNNESLGGEGLLIGNGGLIVDRIYYVYEVSTTRQFGWFSYFTVPQEGTWERFLFDPQTEAEPSFQTNAKPGVAETISLRDCYRSGSRSLYGCPYLQYNKPLGCYTVPNFNLGLRHMLLKQIDRRLPRNWVIPNYNGNLVWDSKQNFALGNVGQRMTIKYFVINPSTGRWQYLMNHFLNLDDSAPGLVSTNLTQSRTFYRESNGSATLAF